MDRYYVGIDPAASTGWAVLDEAGLRLASGVCAGIDDVGYRRFVDTVGQILAPGADIRASIEDQYYSKPRPRKSDGQLSHTVNFKTLIQLARISGLWEGALYQCGMVGRPIFVKASAWRNLVQIPTRPRTKAKAGAMEYCRTVWGHEPICDDEADALCIAAACRLRWEHYE